MALYLVVRGGVGGGSPQIPFFFLCVVVHALGVWTVLGVWGRLSVGGFLGFDRVMLREWGGERFGGGCVDGLLGGD